MTFEMLQISAFKNHVKLWGKVLRQRNFLFSVIPHPTFHSCICQTHKANSQRPSVYQLCNLFRAQLPGTGRQTSQQKVEVGVQCCFNGFVQELLDSQLKCCHEMKGNVAKFKCSSRKGSECKRKKMQPT